MSEPMRIHRALARAGVASRRHAETLIAEGRVLVNGAPAKVGQSIDPAKDRVQVDGRDVTLDMPRARWFVLHKPAGVMTTRRDPEGRRTVFDLVPEVPGLTYVGRLDFLTEGVLLLTTDGEAAHRLTHPSAEVERVYMATVRGNAKKAAEEARAGVQLEDGEVKPAWVNVEALEGRRWGFEVALREGRTREVRRLCAALGLEVERLVRTQFGPVRIGLLEPGQWRELSPREAAMLEVVTGTAVPAGKPPKKRDDRATRGSSGARPARSRGAAPRAGRDRDASARPRRERDAPERPRRERDASARPTRGRDASARPVRDRETPARPARDRETPARPARPHDVAERSSRGRQKTGGPRPRVSSPRRRPREE